MCLLVGDEDLEAVNDLSKGNAPVLPPIKDGLAALGEDNEVVALALVVDTDLGSVAAHVDVYWRWIGFGEVVLVLFEVACEYCNRVVRIVFRWEEEESKQKIALKETHCSFGQPKVACQVG